MRDVWIDFNDIESGDEVETLMSFIEPGVVVTVGASLVVGDDDGTVCDAHVITFDDKILRLRLDRGTLRHLTSDDALRSPVAS